MLVCGADGVFPPLGPAFPPRALINDKIVDTLQAIHVNQANAQEAPSLLFDPTGMVEIVIAAANQKIHQRTLMTSSINRTVGFSSALIM